MEEEEEAASVTCPPSHLPKSCQLSPILTCGTPEPSSCQVRTCGGDSMNGRQWLPWKELVFQF